MKNSQRKKHLMLVSFFEWKRCISLVSGWLYLLYHPRRFDLKWDFWIAMTYYHKLISLKATLSLIKDSKRSKNPQNTSFFWVKNYGAFFSEPALYVIDRALNIACLCPLDCYSVLKFSGNTCLVFLMVFLYSFFLLCLPKQSLYTLTRFCLHLFK